MPKNAETHTIDNDDSFVGAQAERAQTSGPYSISQAIKQSRRLVEESKRIIAESRRNDPPKG